MKSKKIKDVFKMMVFYASLIVLAEIVLKLVVVYGSADREYEVVAQFAILVLIFIMLFDICCDIIDIMAKGAGGKETQRSKASS